MLSKELKDRCIVVLSTQSFFFCNWLQLVGILDGWRWVKKSFQLLTAILRGKLVYRNRNKKCHANFVEAVYYVSKSSAENVGSLLLFEPELSTCLFQYSLSSLFKDIIVSSIWTTLVIWFQLWSITLSFSHFDDHFSTSPVLLTSTIA